MIQALVSSIVLIILAPFIGGLLCGIDRKLTARMQNRIGPPILQPFYDVLKLWGKQPMISSSLQPVLASSYFLFSVVALALLVFRQDLLLAIFTMALADVSLVLGSFSARSPYSYIGGRRELLQILSYEPILILTAVGFYLLIKSFVIENLFKAGITPIAYLPGFFLALLLVLPIEARKSPFDISASHHAHQEIVRGVFTEFSGFNSALIELGHWVKLIFFLSILALFFTPNFILGSFIAFIAFFASMLIDNIFARLTWKSMLKITWSVGLALILVNIALLLHLGV